MVKLVGTLGLNHFSTTYTEIEALIHKIICLRLVYGRSTCQNIFSKSIFSGKYILLYEIYSEIENHVILTMYKKMFYSVKDNIFLKVFSRDGLPANWKLQSPRGSINISKIIIVSL